MCHVELFVATYLTHEGTLITRTLIFKSRYHMLNTKRHGLVDFNIYVTGAAVVDDFVSLFSLGNYHNAVFRL